MFHTSVIVSDATGLLDNMTDDECYCVGDESDVARLLAAKTRSPQLRQREQESHQLRVLGETFVSHQTMKKKLFFVQILTQC